MYVFRESFSERVLGSHSSLSNVTSFFPRCTWIFLRSKSSLSISSIRSLHAGQCVPETYNLHFFIGNIEGKYYSFFPLSLSEFITTDTLDNAIAKPANTGDRRSPKIG